MLHVRLLGELQAEAGGRPVVPPASRRAWSLLAWLALHPGEHPRGTVAARFWPDVLDSSARASLRSAAWALRRALGEGDALVAGRDRIGLRCETDLAAFDAHCAAGELEQAVALHRGPLLADLDEDWVLEARDQHAERLGAVLARLATAAPPAEAVAYARRRLALDPLDEEAARDLMRRLLEAGDRAAALATYDRLADRLRTNLGLATSAETRALAASVRDLAWSVSARSEPPTGAGSRETGEWSGMAGGEPPLVGRATEQAMLYALWERVRGGAGAIALISGEGGIGKTRLATELLTHAHQARTARATAVDLGGGPPPFGPWAELLAGLARELDPPPAVAEWPEELGRLAPSLPRRLGRTPARPKDVPPDLARARLFEAAVELAEHATKDRPLVLLLDDIHLADAPTLELTAYLARRIKDLPVLLVLTRRTLPRRDAIDALIQAAKATAISTEEIELGPLEPEDVERLVGPLPHVIAAADGNPLLAIESARAETTGPSASLRGVVRASIAGLDDDARRTAELAAVAGRDLARAELARLAGPQSVLNATDCGLFRSADGRFGFRHALLREAAYADLDDARRSAHHETLGTQLSNAAECAHHLKRAGRDDLAAGRLVQAAADAIRATAIQEAATYLSEAVTLDPNPATWLELAATRALLGDREASINAFEHAQPHTAHAHLRAAQWFHSSLCDPISAVQAARRGLAAPDCDLDTRVELLLICAWGEVATTGAAAAYVTLAELETFKVDLESDPTRRHHVENLRGFIALAEGRLDEAERELVASGEAGERAARPDLAYGGWANAACVAAVAGDYERALAHAERSATLIAGLPVVEFQVAGLRASALARLGRHTEARAAADRQAQLAERLASPRLKATTDHDTGLLELLAGDHERAQALLEQALEGDPIVHRGDARLRRAEALSRLGRADEADQEIRAAALEPVRPADRPAVLVARMAFAQGLSARARGDHALAERRLHESERHWRRLDRDASGEFLSSLVDLGRPPVTGVADPAYELQRIAEELEAHAHVR
jgi:DNA-binding SARP family transcriptional activator/tetratricopeptide (TPR) repeat protein